MAAIKSRSGQFIACASHGVKPPAAEQILRFQVGGGLAYGLQSKLPPRTAEAAQELDPALLTVSCERLKDALLAELKLTDQWRGRINLNIDSSLPEDSEPFLTAVLGRSGWRYEVDLPSSIKSERLLNTLIHVMLLEMANRNAAGEASAHIPLWLVEGVLADIQANSVSPFLIRRQLSSTGNRLALQQLEPVRAQLRSRPPLSFQELSWPEETSPSSKDEKFYRACAQLFVHDLLRLKDGRQCLCRMLEKLPQRLNWQVAFLDAFSPHFTDLRDVEKWWALACIHLTRHDSIARWTPQESWQKLQEALDVPVQVHLDRERLPADAAITLQEVIQEWAPETQIATLRRTLDNLYLIQPRIAPELADIVNQYRTVLFTYVHAHPSVWLSWLKADNASSRFKLNTCKELTSLDSQRDGIKARMVATVSETESLQLSAKQPPTRMP